MSSNLNSFIQKSYNGLNNLLNNGDIEFLKELQNRRTNSKDMYGTKLRPLSKEILFLTSFNFTRDFELLSIHFLFFVSDSKFPMTWSFVRRAQF